MSSFDEENNYDAFGFLSLIHSAYEHNFDP